MQNQGCTTLPTCAAQPLLTVLLTILQQLVLLMVFPFQKIDSKIRIKSFDIFCMMWCIACFAPTLEVPLETAKPESQLEKQPLVPVQSRSAPPYARNSMKDRTMKFSKFYKKLSKKKNLIILVLFLDFGLYIRFLNTLS